MKQVKSMGVAIIAALFLCFATTGITAATFTVTRSDDRNATCNSGVDCSLREAVAAANALSTNDIINFVPVISTIILTSEITITNNGTLTITGRGANVFSIDGGEGTNRIFYTDIANVVITDVTLMGGNGVGAGSSNQLFGGAVYVNSGSLTLDRVHVRGNNVRVGLYGTGYGGGVYVNGGTNHLVRNSTFSANIANAGGGLSTEGGLVTIVNSTFSDNSASFGGGIYSNGDISLRNVTINNNRATNYGVSSGAGGGIANRTGVLNIGNTIVSGNICLPGFGSIGPSEISFDTGTISSVGNNLIGDSVGDSTNTGNPINYHPTDIRDTPPVLSTLGMYGGSTPTLALLFGSPAIDTGNNTQAINPLNNSPLTIDQPGLRRISDGNADGVQTVDVGSFEFRSTAIGCSYSLGSSNQSFPVLGGNGSFSIITSPSCAWDAQSDFSWLNLASGSGIGNGTIQFTVQPNSGAARSGTLWVGGQTFTVNQANGCTFTLSSSSTQIPANGGSSSFDMISGSGCNWTAVSNDSWLTVTSGSNGQGNGTISFSVQSNSGPARTGTITSGGQIFTVNQPSGCSYSLSASSANFPATGGITNVNVTGGAGCTWTAASNDSWIIVNSGNNGNGNGSVNFTVGPNSAPSRTGTLTIAGQTFTVNQTNGCAFTLTPTGTSFPAAGGSGSFNITASNAGCTWASSTTGSWISIVGGTSGTGNGSISFTVQVNVSPARTGSIDVNGQTFSISQATGCNYTLSASGTNIPASGGTGNLNINVGTGCTWTANSNSSWVSVTSGSSGSGSGTISFTVQPNIFGARTGAITTTGGQTFTIVQAAAARPYRPNFDFDGDGKADFSVFRASENKWYILQSSDFTVVQKVFAIAGDVPAPADYDGDGKTDVAIFRPSSGDWWYLSSINNAQIPVQWGQAGDIPRPSDFDGDGKADFIVYRPSNSVWYRMGSTGAVSILAFGIAEDKSLIGDFDGDGNSDFAIFRPSTGDWWYTTSSAGGQFRATHWGASGDIPVPADYDGDGKTDFAVFRPSDGGWYIANSSNGSYTILSFGLSSDKPIAADYDGDGKADIAVYRPSTGIWYLLQTTAGFGALQFGISTDIAIPNAFVR